MLESIQKNTYSLLTSYSFWLILIVSFIFIVIAFYIYSKYVTPVLNKDFIENDEFNDASKNNKKEAEIIIFTVEWCPHSKKAMPIWNELKEKYNENPINNYKLIFTQIDGEANPEMADQYKVEGYPTIKLVKGNQVIEYDAKPSIEHLTEFLNSTLS